MSCKNCCLFTYWCSPLPQSLVTLRITLFIYLEKFSLWAPLTIWRTPLFVFINIVSNLWALSLTFSSCRAHHLSRCYLQWHQKAAWHCNDPLGETVSHKGWIGQTPVVYKLSYSSAEGSTHVLCILLTRKVSCWVALFLWHRFAL